MSRLLSCFALVLCCQIIALAAEPVVTPGPTGTYEIYRFEMDGFPGGRTTGMVTMVGGGISHLAIAHNNLNVSPFWHDMRTEGGAIMIDVWVAGDHKDNYNFVPMQLQIQRNSERLEGTWTLAASRWVGRFEGRNHFNDTLYEGVFESRSASARFMRNPTDLSGAISGQVISEAALAAGNAVPDDALWDNYLGPNENFSASGDDQPAIVENLSEARVLWRSPFIGGVEICGREPKPRFNRPPVGGGASPVLADGRIFQYHFRPSGDLRYTDASANIDRWKKHGATIYEPLGISREELERQFRIQADDVVTCLDAATGRILWEAVFSQEAMNLFFHKAGVNNLTPVVADGVVYVLGNRGELRALRAEDGAVLWQTRVESFYNSTRDEIEAALAAAREGRRHTRPFLTRAFNTGLVCVDGVVVVPSGHRGGSLMGYDAASGQQLWRAGGLAFKATPLIAEVEGGAIILSNTSTHIMALDPRSGVVLWREELSLPVDGPKYSTSMALDGDILLSHGGGYRVSRAGAEHLYDLPGAVHCRAVATVIDGVALVRTGDGKDFGPIANWRIATATGEVLSQDTELSQANDEAHSFALSGRFIMEEDSQHGTIKWTAVPAEGEYRRIGRVGTTPFPPATAYSVPIGYALADGRMWIRGKDGLYCLDLRTE